MQTKHPDYKYIEGIASGNSKILDEIYKKYSKAILKLVLDNNGTIEDTKDVIQESLIIIYKKTQIQELELTSNFLSYFYSIARHVWWKMLDKKNLGNVSINDNLGLINDNDIETTILKRERHIFFLKKLKDLSAGCRQILGLYIEGKKAKEIAKILGFKSEVYARKRKFQCKEQLINRIKQDHKYQELVQD